jgi:hypothetical protein
VSWPCSWATTVVLAKATMALSWKSADGKGNGVPTVEQLRRKERALGLGMEAVRDQAYARTTAVLGHERPEPTPRAVKAAKIDPRPIRVATFDC